TPHDRHRVAGSTDCPVEPALDAVAGALPDAQERQRFPQRAVDPGCQASPASDLPSRHRPGTLQSGSPAARYPALVHSSETDVSEFIPTGSYGRPLRLWFPPCRFILSAPVSNGSVRMPIPDWPAAPLWLFPAEVGGLER